MGTRTPKGRPALSVVAVAGTWPELTADSWVEMLRKQRESARTENGVYQGEPDDLPRATVDEVIALCMYYERPFSDDDNWAHVVGDFLIVALAAPDDKGRATRSLGDILQVDEAARVWRQLLKARAEQLDPLCATIPFPPPPAGPGGYEVVGHCPGRFKYDAGTTAQMRRLERLTLAVQRVRKIIKPPPVLDPIGSLLRGVGWVVLLLLILSSAEKPRRR
jgi:hypothetical protein